MTPKERVRANIYKTLLEEEKRKNKRKSLFSLSLFVLGMFTSSTYQMLFKETNINSMDKYVINRNVSEKFLDKNDITLDHIFQTQCLMIKSRNKYRRFIRIRCTDLVEENKWESF